MAKSIFVFVCFFRPDALSLGKISLQEIGFLHSCVSKFVKTVHVKSREGNVKESGEVFRLEGEFLERENHGKRATALYNNLFLVDFDIKLIFLQFKKR